MQADALEPEQWREQLQGAVGVVSCLGGFGSNEFMLKVSTHAKFPMANRAEGVNPYCFTVLVMLC